MFDFGVNLMDSRFNPLSIIDEAKTAGLSGLLVISSDIEESYRARRFCEQHSSSEFLMIFTAGVHPHQAKTWTSESSEKLRELVQHPNCFAIGECGLDFNRNFSTPEEQLFAFEEQLIVAKDTSKGVYLHERDAFSSQLALLEQHSVSLPFRIVHCFTGTKEQAKRYMALDCFFGITGWLCDNARGQSLRDAMDSLPLNRLIMETDAPYLFPKTMRPKQSMNHPKNLFFISQEAANLKGVDVHEFTRQIDQNVSSLLSVMNIK